MQPLTHGSPLSRILQVFSTVSVLDQVCENEVPNVVVIALSNDASPKVTSAVTVPLISLAISADIVKVDVVPHVTKCLSVPLELQVTYFQLAVGVVHSFVSHLNC